MKSFDYEAVVIDGAVWCDNGKCAVYDDEDDRQGRVNPIFADSEWDHYPVCEGCGAEHDYVSLTPDGQRWLSRRQWSPAVREYAERLDAEGLKLPQFTSIGCYTVRYLEHDGADICADCANDHSKELKLVCFGTYDEGPTLQCEECGADIESSYGDPDAEG